MPNYIVTEVTAVFNAIDEEDAIDRAVNCIGQQEVIEQYADLVEEE